MKDKLEKALRSARGSIEAEGLFLCTDLQKEIEAEMTSKKERERKNDGKTIEVYI